MENLIFIMPSIFGAITAGICVIVTLIFALRKQRAQQKYLKVLAAHRHELVSLRNEIIHDGQLDRDELNTLVKQLNKYSQEIPKSEQRYISEALLQKSIRGRARYAGNLLKKIGAPIINT